MGSSSYFEEGTGERLREYHLKSVPGSSAHKRESGKDETPCSGTGPST